VYGQPEAGNRFNGFPRESGKPLKRLASLRRRITWLKPGVNKKVPFQE